MLYLGQNSSSVKRLHILQKNHSGCFSQKRNALTGSLFSNFFKILIFGNRVTLQNCILTSKSLFTKHYQKYLVTGFLTHIIPDGQTKVVYMSPSILPNPMVDILLL